MSKLKTERIRRGWSQQILGFHAGISAADISKIENLRMVPYPGQAERLSKVLGLLPAELQQPAQQEAVSA